MRKKRALVNDARKESARLWKQYLNGRIWDDVDALCDETLRATSCGMEPSEHYEVARLFLLSKLIDEANVRRGRKPKKKGLIHSVPTIEKKREWLLKVYGAKAALLAEIEQKTADEILLHIRRNGGSGFLNKVTDRAALAAINTSPEEMKKMLVRLRRAKKKYPSTALFELR